MHAGGAETAEGRGTAKANNCRPKLCCGNVQGVPRRHSDCLPLANLLRRADRVHTAYLLVLWPWSLSRRLARSASHIDAVSLPQREAGLGFASF
jgi:hypothetical protein